MSIRIAEEIINGRRLNREDDLAFFMEEDLDSLCRGADEIRRRLRGDRADLCSIINGRQRPLQERIANSVPSHHATMQR